MKYIGAALLLLGGLWPRPACAGSLLDFLYVKIGDMRPGSGIGGGIELRKDHFPDGIVDLRFESKASIRLYQQHEMEAILPHFLHPRVYLEIIGLYRSYTQVDFFGIGPDSREDDHSNYRIHGLASFGTLGFRPARGSQVGLRVGYLQTKIGRGTDDALPSAEDRFDPVAVPGLQDSPNHALIGAFVAFDDRDDPEDPHSGRFYELQSTRYEDLDSDQYAFYDVDYDIQHFVPLGDRVTLALRASGVFTGTADGREVPFYLLPSLGGSDSLHAFENDRFRDRHLLFLNNELRYRASPTIRLELFVDAGEVFPRLDAFRPEALELSSGFGIRYKFRRKILVGVSAGFGREGGRVSFRGDLRF